MKKKNIVFLICFILICFIFVGCGSSKATSSARKSNESSTSTKAPSKKNQPTQAELNTKFKAEAIKADLVQINEYEDAYKNKKVYVEGKVYAVNYEGDINEVPNFTLWQLEGNGYGVYTIINHINVKGLKHGDTVKVWGTLEGKSKSGAPNIVAAIIEREN